MATEPPADPDSSLTTDELPWADGPCPLIHTPTYLTQKTDIWTKGATHMALLHNAILRGLNSIYLQAPHVRPADYADFVGYSLAWHRLVKSHHDDEEAELFPRVEGLLNEKGVWDVMLLEHASFTDGLQAFHLYLSTTSTSSFSGKELVNILDSFRDALTHHLHSEIQTIASLSAVPSDLADAAALTFKTWGKQTLTKAGLTDVVPFALLNMDAGFEEGMWAGWPPMPWVVKWVLVNVCGGWNAGWWRFSSCDSLGAPRALYALQ